MIKYKESFTQIESIPKVIYTYWSDENIPEIVNLCIKSWKYYNPQYKIIIINKTNYKNFCDIQDLENLKHNDTVKRESDFIRLATLSKNGGVWMDASIICFTPLPKITSFMGYYFDGFTINKKFPVIESWFFACHKNCKFVNDWKNEFFSINNYEKIEDYVANVKSKGIVVDGIDNTEYLCIHVSAQKVLQENMHYRNQMVLLKAEDGPYSYLALNNWDIIAAFDWLRSFSNVCGPLIKLRSMERDFLQENYDYHKFIFNFLP